jgi:hypothetical protein
MPREGAQALLKCPLAAQSFAAGQANVQIAARPPIPLDFACRLRRRPKIHIATITFRLEDSAALSNAASQFSSLKRSEIKSSTFTSRVAKT